MEISAGVVVAVLEQTQVSEARRRAHVLAHSFGFDETALGRLAIVVTEAATNLIKHGGGGEIYLGPATSGGSRGVEVIAVDRGRGIASVPASVADGYSTAGSPGTGLGAIRRAATSFDIYSFPAVGTVVAATVFADSPPPPSFAGVSVPAPGEIDCGDGWAVWSAGQLTSIFLCDGLGHGTEAARATAAAIGAFRQHAERPAADVIRFVFDALKSTRGAAVAIAELDHRVGRLEYCGLGNIAGVIVDTDGRSQHLVSHNGIAGHTMRRLQSFTYPWSQGDLIVLHSDGVATSWTLKRYAGIGARRPDVVAGLLYRDFRRGRDDATVVVARHGIAA